MGMSMVAVVGSLNLDLVVPVPRHPRPGETVLGGDLVEHPGGKGGNQAVAAARLGGRGRVAMVGRVGADAAGERLRAALAAEGVDVSRVRSAEGRPSGRALVAVDERTGENTIIVSPGANAALLPQDVAAEGALLRDAVVTVLQQEVPADTVEAAARLAGGTVLLNPAPARPLTEHLRDGLLPMVDVLVPNRGELGVLVGEELPDLHAVADAARRLRGPAAVVVTLGADGALLCEDGAVLLVPPHPVRPVDTTAAGDAFCGALAVCLAERLPLHEAVRLANTAAALATTRPGAQPSLPTRAELDRALAPTH